jgi:pyruvate dehydrogenase (quinone)
VERAVDRWHENCRGARPPGDAAAQSEHVIRALSDHLPADAQVSLDAGSVVYWYARHLPEAV